MFNDYPHTDLHELNLDWIIKKVKELAAAWTQVQQDWTDEQAAFANLQSWIENYFNNLDVQTEINVKLDSMVAAGTMSELIAPYVESGLPAEVADQIGDVVAAQIGPVVAAQISAVVAAQLPAVAAAAAAQEVSAWLAIHVDPETGYVIDDSLTINGAAADAKATGDAIGELKSALMNNEIKTNDVIGMAFVKFEVLANKAHSSLNDQIKITIPSNSLYFIVVETPSISSYVNFYEIASDGTYYEQTSINTNNSGLYKAVKDIVKIGCYIPSQESAYSAKITIYTVDGFYNEVADNGTSVSGLEGISDKVQNITWEKKSVKADGSDLVANAATSEIVYSAYSAYIADNCRAVVGFYNGSTYLGKLNANGEIDKVSGSWGYLTGYCDLTELLMSVNANGFRLTLFPTDGIVLSDDTVQSYGTIMSRVYAHYNNVIDFRYENWFERGTIINDGTNQDSVTRVRSDFRELKGAKDINFVFPSDKWLSCTFYGDISFTSFISQSSEWIKTSSHIAIPNDAKYYRFIVRNADDSTLTLDDIALNSIAVKLFTNCNDVSTDIFDNEITVQEHTTIKSVNHRGYNADAPENTLPAYKLSRKHGFKYVETDIRFTSDNVPVLLHDSTINRTARDANGDAPQSTISIYDIDYDTALTYDFGRWKGDAYIGTKIPTFDEFLVLCKKLSLIAFLDIKPDNLNSARQSIIVNAIKKNGMENDVVLMCTSSSVLTSLRSEFPNALLVYGVGNPYTEAKINDIINTVNSLKTLGSQCIASIYYPEVTTSMYNQLKSENVNTIIWTVDKSDVLTSIDDSVVAVLSDTLNAGSIIEKLILS